MNNPLVYQAIGVLLVLFYIFLLVMCWKTWRVAHILLRVSRRSRAAATFLIFASFVLKTHSGLAQALRAAHGRGGQSVKAENEQYLHGDLEDVQQDRAIRSAALRASVGPMAEVDRGRIWRECRPTFSN
jgi:hypothetical protein